MASPDPQAPGTPLPDILCTGILVADLFLPPLPALPAAGQLCVTEDFLADSGGCAANVATALSRLGLPAAVEGRVGSDLFGDFIVNDLRAKGVDVTGIRRSAASGTSKTVILPVVGEDRRYVHTFGANAEFCADDIDLERVPGGGVLYLGGFLAMPALRAEDVGRLFRKARERGIIVVLDVVVPAGEGGGAMEQLAGVLPHVDYFLPNREEAEAILGDADPVRQARSFREAGCACVVITDGGKGAVLMNARETLLAPAYPVEVVDGSGAGDAMAAGFIAGLREGWPVRQALQFGSAVGAMACTRLGCNAGIRTRAETEAFIRENPWEARIIQAG